jgi:hypothetical protein
MTRHAAPAPGQYDLFGEIEQAEREAAERKTAAQSARAEWAARFERVDWVAPYDTASGMKKGDRTPGWRCPDPECGQVEPNTFHLSINHGWDPDVPGHEPYDGRCRRLRLLANHAIYDKRRAMIRHLAAEGMDDEQIAARIGFWSAPTIAGYRKEDAKAARLAAKAAKGEIVKVGHGSDCPCAHCDGPCTCPSCKSLRGNR